MLPHLDNIDEIDIKRTKVRGYFKRNSRGKQIWVSPHYRALVKHSFDNIPAFQRKFLIKIPEKY